MDRQEIDRQVLRWTDMSEIKQTNEMYRQKRWTDRTWAGQTDEMDRQEMDRQVLRWTDMRLTDRS